MFAPVRGAGSLRMEKLVEMGVPKAVASVVLPLGYAFNRDGSIMFLSPWLAQMSAYSPIVDEGVIG